jgi:CubicO group peptidase (beta-lactamase class C family)
MMGRRHWIIGMGLSALLPRLAHAATPDTRADAMERVLGSRGAPPAMAAGLIGTAGLEWSGAVGLRRAQHPDTVDLDDLWHLGSNTKAMTAALWIRLIEQGRAVRDMTLEQAFPDLTVDAALARLTVEDLLRHKAGLLDAGLLPLPIVAWADTRPVTEQRAAIARMALAKAPNGRPGRFSYANINYVLAGAAIERITGQSWEAAMEEEIFSPLGIRTAGFGAPQLNARGGANAWGHEGSARAYSSIDPTAMGSDNPAMLGPAGTVHMSVSDYGQFLQAMTGRGPSGWISGDGLSRLVSAADGDSYALGWITQPDGVVAHEGSNTLWHVITLMQPQTGRVVFVASNGGMAGRTVTVPFAQQLMAGIG